MNPEIVRQWYVDERASYREIMKRMGINNPRKVKKLLADAGVEPRDRSESIKTQWEGNEKRRKQQAAAVKKRFKGNTQRRLPDNEIEGRFDAVGLLFLFREIIDGYSIVHYICKKCWYRGSRSLRNDGKGYGCPQCAINDRTIADQSTVRAIRSKARAWRRLVIERDGHKCKKCGARKNLRAHHIENFAENEQLRLDVDNGITLCAECHDCGYPGSFHMVYGVYKTTGKQLSEFLVL